MGLFVDSSLPSLGLVVPFQGVELSFQIMFFTKLISLVPFETHLAHQRSDYLRPPMLDYFVIISFNYQLSERLPDKEVKQPRFPIIEAFGDS